jgi:flagellar hook-associated protein 3 FlgL
MRVTDRMMYESAAQNAARSRDAVQNATQEVSTGIRVNHPGDDPVAAALIVQAQQTSDQATAIGTNAARAGAELDTADQALQNMGNVLTRARELAVQMGDDSNSASDRADAASEVTGLLNQAVSLMNTDVNGRYIFGGDQDTTPPFDAAGNYSGDAAVRQVEVAPGVLQDASVRGDVVAKGTGGGVDIFATLQSLSTALSTNNGAGIRGALTDLQTATTQVTSADAQVGTMGDVFTTAQTLATNNQLAATTSISKEADADPFDAASKLALANYALNATLSASATSLQLSLVNKLQ